MKKSNRIKAAAISMEMLLSITLAVGVLFLVLGLFNSNLKDMSSHGGFNNLFRKNSATAYEQGAAFRQDSDKSYTNSQVNVKIIAEQGLQVLMTQAQAGIDKFYTQSTGQNPTPLTAGEQIDLIKYFVDKSMLAHWGVVLSNTALTGASNRNLWPESEQKLARDNGINPLYNPPLPIKVTIATFVKVDSTVNPSKTIRWSSLPIEGIVNFGATGNKTEEEQISYINKVNTSIDSYK